MRTKMQKYTSAMMAAVMALSMGGMQTSAADDVQNIVVIGDSVAAGNALTDAEQSYVELVGEYTGAKVQNFAAAGNTTQDVLDCLDHAQVQAALAEADVILVSVGMHDIMDPFMAKANEFMVQFGFQRFSDVFFASLADYNLDELDLMIYNGQLTSAVESNMEPAAANMLEIGEQLAAYPNAQVILSNAYNPIDTIENLDELSSKRKDAYTTVCTTVSNTLNASVNQAIAETAAANGYEVVDVHAAFKGFAYKYVNLSDLDMNATAAGHALIAQKINALLGVTMTGDVNMDGAIDATDAAAVLIHAANTGSGGSGTLSDAAETAADVNKDGTADSADAAKILIYAAELGADGNPSWD